MQCFGDVFEKNIDVDVFDDVLQNAKHWANDASNDVNRPPLLVQSLQFFEKADTNMFDMTARD